MEQQQLDAGTIAALMLRLKDYRLPRAKRLLKKVNEGQKLSDHDIRWLKTIHADSIKVQELVKRNPEYSGLLARTIDLCLFVPEHDDHHLALMTRLQRELADR